MSTPSVQSFYTRLVLDVSADDRTLFWAIALSKYALLAGMTSVLNGKDGSVPVILPTTCVLTMLVVVYCFVFLQKFSML